MSARAIHSVTADRMYILHFCQPASSIYLVWGYCDVYIPLSEWKHAASLISNTHYTLTSQHIIPPLSGLTWSPAHQPAPIPPSSSLFSSPNSPCSSYFWYFNLGTSSYLLFISTYSWAVNYIQLLYTHIIRPLWTLVLYPLLLQHLPVPNTRMNHPLTHTNPMIHNLLLTDNWTTFVHNSLIF